MTMATATTRETEVYVRTFGIGYNVSGVDDQSNLIIKFRVDETYLCSDRALKCRIREHIGEFLIQCPYHSITYDLLYRMIARISIPFPLEKMKMDCKPPQEEEEKVAELDNIDDLIRYVLDEARSTVNSYCSESESAGVPKMIIKLDVYIENRVILPRHEIESMNRAKEKGNRALELRQFVSTTIRMMNRFMDFHFLEREIVSELRDTAPKEKAFLDNNYEQKLELSLLARAMRQYFQALETPRFKGDLIDDKGEQQVVCAICKDEIFIGSRVVRMPCSHMYHVRCIAEWLKRSLMCPLCRFKLTTRVK